MLPLDDILWSNLSPAPFAASYPTILRELPHTIASGRYSRECLVPLSTLCHQWSTYDSTLAAIPHLVRICCDVAPENTARIDLLTWIGWCVACVRLNRQDGPDQLKQWYDSYVVVARDLIAESLPFSTAADGEPRNLRGLLAAFAACHGNPALAFMLYELENGGFKCDYCNSFLLPMKSSMNPFWRATESGKPGGIHARDSNDANP